MVKGVRIYLEMMKERIKKRGGGEGGIYSFQDANREGQCEWHNEVNE